MCGEQQKHNAIDLNIASGYTGIDRDHLKFIRKQCGRCTPGTEVTAMIHLDDSPVICDLLMASRALKLRTNSFANVITTPTTKHYSISTLSEVKAFPLSLTTRCSSVIWIGCERSSAESIPTQMLRHRHASAVNSALVPSCFLRGKAEQLQSVVGSSFLRTGHEHVDAHQSIIIASFLADSRGVNLEVGTSTWLLQQLQNEHLLLRSSTLLLLAWHRYDPKDRTVENICAYMRKQRPGTLRMFPSAEELEYAQQKVGDIQALDQIAKCGPGRWSFRPLTCDSTSGCQLTVNSVLKRTHSCGSEHVIVHPTAADLSKHLQCLSRQRRVSRRQACQSVGRWFHQEFVAGLRSEGEYRVFIITRNDTLAPRQRKGVVMEMVHTLELPDKELVVTVLRPNSMLRDGPCQHNNNDLTELEEFAMYVFDALRNRSDWSTKYESLEVGVRLDIGVSLASGKRQYFVNEITRIYEADVFAEWLAQPGTHICKAVSGAIEEVFMIPSD
jgi:hypothetical protein